MSRYRRNPSLEYPEELLALLLSRSSIDTNTGCRNWWGYRTQAGYGQLSIGNTRYIVSRLMWIASKGVIENNLHVLHRCDNPACINIEHLFLGTPADNSKDKVAKGRASGGVAEHTMPMFDIPTMLKIKAEKDTNRNIAKGYNCSEHTIGRIKKIPIKQ